jgi:methylated-DNA-protein-cysteine methyltransferase-like protein
MAADLYERIREVVRLIPEGRVATYGQVALVAGLPGHARQVGYAMGSLPEGSDVPWHRVINARGRVSRRAAPGWDELQRLLLLEEGIVFRADGSIDLDRFGWEP